MKKRAYLILKSPLNYGLIGLAVVATIIISDIRSYSPDGSTSLIKVGGPEGKNIIACLQGGNIPHYFGEQGIQGDIYIEERYEKKFITVCT